MPTSRKVGILSFVAAAGLVLSLALPHLPAWLKGVGVFLVAGAGIGLVILGIGESRRGGW